MPDHTYTSNDGREHSANYVSGNPAPPQRLRAQRALERAQAEMIKAENMQRQAEVMAAEAVAIAKIAQAEIDTQKPTKPKAKAKAKATK